MTNYKGYYEWNPTEAELAAFYQDSDNLVTNNVSDTLNHRMLQNEYLIVNYVDSCEAYDTECSKQDCYSFKGHHLYRIPFRSVSSRYCGDIKPRNVYQNLAIDMLYNRDTPVKIFQGTYGCGKDYLMSAVAMDLIDQKAFEKIIYIRPNVSLGGVPEIGYLKGTLDDKLSWTLAPLWDKFGGKDAIDMFQKSGKIEMVPLPFIRGRSFENSIVYVSEGQNITKEVAAVILSRIGDNSELWINGDCHAQTDKRLYDTNNGISAMIEKLKGSPLFQMVYSPVTERSSVARLASILMDD